MFADAEIGSRIGKQDYEAEVPGLRVDLVNAQIELRDAPFPVLIVLVGDDRLGVSQVVERLCEWMDARFVATRVFGEPTDEELHHPRFWRYWKALPARGELALYTGPWVLGTLAERLTGAIDEAELDRRLVHMRRFEQTLVDEGALVLKFWVHLPKTEVKKRAKRARKNGNPLDAFDRLIDEHRDEIIRLSEHVVRMTDVSNAPWQVVESTDARHRDLTIARAVHAALSDRLARKDPPPPPTPVPSRPEPPKILDTIDLDSTITREEAKEQRGSLQRRLRQLSLRAREQDVASVLVFEGVDAAGKGGTIRRIAHGMYVQDYRIVPIAAPTDEELNHHYLWRFWRRIPRKGSMVIFDRSWYGRLLVERVEGLASESAVQRGYAEINDLEEQLVEEGCLLLKFWLHIDRDEQARRFAERERTAHKRFKITDEDYRNREKWGDYELAINEMLDRTGTRSAPWHLIPSNDKRFARVEVLKTVCDALGERVGEDG